MLDCLLELEVWSLNGLTESLTIPLLPVLVLLNDWSSLITGAINGDPEEAAAAVSDKESPLDTTLIKLERLNLF